MTQQKLVFQSGVLLLYCRGLSAFDLFNTVLRNVSLSFEIRQKSNLYLNVGQQDCNIEGALINIFFLLILSVCERGC